MTATVYAANTVTAKGLRSRWKLPFAVLVFTVIAVGIGWSLTRTKEVTQEKALDMVIPPDFQPQRAMKYLEDVCAIGPRASGTPGMQRQQQLLTEFFRGEGAEVNLQTFRARHPLTGQPVEMNNIIASWFPEAKRRVLISAHYDTRPFPNLDPRRPQGTFIGANDGASGTAVLMELSHHIPKLPGNVGVDLVLFDGEELVYQDGRDEYFLGSTHFARTYAAGQMNGKYDAGVLLDMVGDRELTLYYEVNSLKYAKTVCQEVWGAAKRLRIDAFIPRTRHEVRDDHLPLNTIAKIPTADVIDFDYPRPMLHGNGYWHTEQDTPDKCSGQSLAAVAAVMFEWLKYRSGVNK